MKILIAGLGSIGRRHLKNLISLGESDIVLYRTHKSSLPDEELDKFPVETDLRKAFGNKPDAVIISNPTAMHMVIAEQLTAIYSLKNQFRTQSRVSVLSRQPLKIAQVLYLLDSNFALIRD